MPTWLTTAIWIILWLWSLLEIAGLWLFIKYPKARYNVFGAIKVYLWVLFTICWFSYQYID
jgi:hypothetical protein